MVRLELGRTDTGDPIEAALTRERYRLLAPRVGERVYVETRNLRVFPDSPAGRRSSRSNGRSRHQVGREVGTGCPADLDQGKVCSSRAERLSMAIATKTCRSRVGDRLSREEFHQRDLERADIKKAELVEGVVYVP